MLCADFVARRRPAAPPAAPPAGPFPFPVGTLVAVEFSGVVYEGKITEHCPEGDSCMVVFTDGDTAEYDADEIEYAAGLHARDFGDNAVKVATV